METRIYVGNLAQATTEEEIKTLFAQAGSVTQVDLIKERGSGLSKGFAFVTMSTQDEVNKAVTMFNAYSLAGKELKVDIAKPRGERAAIA